MQQLSGILRIHNSNQKITAIIIIYPVSATEMPPKNSVKNKTKKPWTPSANECGELYKIMQNMVLAGTKRKPLPVSD